MNTFVEVPEDLLNALIKQFPDQCPDVSTPIEEVRALAGEQRVIRFLRRMFEEQNENILTREVL